MPHIVEALREDHQRMGALFQRILNQTNGATEHRGLLAQALRRALSAHSAFKEEVFYPALRESAEVTERIGEAVAELDAMEGVIARLEGLEPASADFTAALGELGTMMRRHAERDEDAIFPVALRALDRLDAEEMSERHDALARAQA